MLFLIVSLADVVLQSRLMDAEGNVVGEVASELQVIPACPNEVEQEIVVKNPNLWSVNTPYIYKVNSILIDKTTGKVLDNYCTNTGIRTFRFDVQKGFILNGERLKINGVCMHHDLGCLGAALSSASWRYCKKWAVTAFAVLITLPHQNCSIFVTVWDLS